jgi:tRNA threonylcarbamoyladenosine biosynthesis protein TsaE
MGDQRSWLLQNEEATEAFGAALGSVLMPGDVISLVGPLGAGKTRLLQAVARRLRVPEGTVQSPTFTLMHEYPATRDDGSHLVLRHSDAYRIQSVAEFIDLGLDELFSSDGAAIVEWGNLVTAALPIDHLQITLHTLSPTARRTDCVARGPASHQLLEQLTSAWGQPTVCPTPPT